MPLTGTVKNQISSQLEAVFDAIEAGTAFETNDWIHNSTVFNSGGHQYVTQALPEGDLTHPSVVVQVKRTLA